MESIRRNTQICSLQYMEAERFGIAVMLWSRIREVIGSNFDWTPATLIIISWFSLVLPENSCIISRLGHDPLPSKSFPIR
jgi:hypothetical protein